MMNQRWKQRARGLAAVLCLAAPLTACDEEIEYDYSASAQVARVNAIRITIGNQTMTVFKDGKVTLGPLVLIRPSADVSTVLLDENDQEITGADAKDIRVDMGRLTGGSTLGVTFTRTSDFSGRFTATTAGTTNFTISLFDKVNRRPAFGPYTMAMIVR